jgi:hypothetical protein
MPQPLPAQGFYISPATIIRDQLHQDVAYWTGTRKGAKYVRADVLALTHYEPKWLAYHWPCALGFIKGTDGPVTYAATFAEACALVHPDLREAFTKLGDPGAK